MIPRGRPDIGWRDLAYALACCLRPGDLVKAQQRAEAAWLHGESLACLSVRSGFDLVLQALQLPPGSEVLVSAVTIRDMVRIIEHHGLVAVPVDVDVDTLAVSPTLLEQAITPRTRAVLVAHLFGSRMPLDGIAEVARRHGLTLFEDCAQAYDGPAYQGHEASDVCMFSFGPIKTQTALGGALLRFKDAALREKVRRMQAAYPRQRRQPFARRVLLVALLKLLSRPALFRLFVLACHMRGISHDQLITASLRGFPGADLMTKLRHQPCAPLLRLLAWRLKRADVGDIRRRATLGERLAAALGEVPRPGSQALPHNHWVFPMLAERPGELTQLLWHSGFDATRGASSLHVVPSPEGTTATTPQAETMLTHVVYLPLHPVLNASAMRRLAEVVGESTADYVLRKSSSMKRET
ncbi:MAG: DegT/DnrJ/EryC1/StrS family aminotransferase [Chloroflexaceae bacterium]|jgi:dTDP-4-amino-4,6-dideoxygalactose transaminase|nr:DegT/DnrJ/EryC1/StrS family aminotransferase [Chloroflexaceae bacterium]